MIKRFSIGCLEAGKQILDHHSDALLYAIATSCRAKAAIVSMDEREAGMRALLNLGHSFSHALEKLAEYDSDIILHGEAVAIGIIMAFKLSEILKRAPSGTAKIIEQHFAALGMKTSPFELKLKTALDSDILLQAMLGDKKNSQGIITLIVPNDIGECVIDSSFTAAKLAPKLKKLLAQY